MSIIMGVDLGNSNTRVAALGPTGKPEIVTSPLGETQIPSVVYFGDKDIIVGTEALNQSLADPSHSAINWKRSLGQDTILCQNGQPYLAQDIIPIILGYAAQAYRQKTGQIPTDVAISVPANYDDQKKQLTIDGAKKVGLNVVCLPSEPTAALLGNNVHQRGDGFYAVFDIGGSTTDVSVGKVSGNSLTIIYTDGVPNLGGQDYSKSILEYALAQFEQKCGIRLTPESDALDFQDLVQRVEQAKITLSVKDQASLPVRGKGKFHNVVLTRQEYERLTAEFTEGVLQCAQRALKGAGVTADQLKEIFVVGGPSRTPALIRGVESRFHHKPSAQCDPHHATALGSAAAARAEVERQGCSVQVGDITLPPDDKVTHDVTAHDIGVVVVRNKTDLINAVILPKGARIPSDQTKPFKLAEPDQTEVHIEILQGPDGAKKEDCLLLGHFDLKGMTPVHDDIHRIDIRFRLDKNGMLTATGYDPLSGVKADLSIDYKRPPSPSTNP